MRPRSDAGAFLREGVGARVSAALNTLIEHLSRCCRCLAEYASVLEIRIRSCYEYVIWEGIRVFWIQSTHQQGCGVRAGVADQKQGEEAGMSTMDRIVETGIFVDGAARPASNGATYDLFNPARTPQPC